MTKRRVGRALIAIPVVLLYMAFPGGTTPGAAAPDPAAGSDGLGDPYYPKDGNEGYAPTHYDVTIDYNPSTHRLAGHTVISAVATQFLHTFNLDFTGPAVRAVTVNGLTSGWHTTADKPDTHELTIVPTLPLLPGLPFVVTVDYEGIQTDHLATSKTTDGGWAFSPSGGAFAAGEPHSAATWYPLDDSPLAKATFTLHATVPREWDVVSNGIRTRNEVSGATRTVTWEERAPVAGYLTTVAIDRFSYLYQARADGTPLISAFAPGTESHRKTEARLPEILDFEQQLYGPYPFDAGGGIYVDTKLPFSLETQTRPIYAPWTELSVVVHENAHQWWGDSTSVRHWMDICLNECFASYTADYLWPERKEHADVDAKYRDTITRMRSNAKFWRTPLYDPGARKEFSAVYTRGPLFLHALRRTVGDGVFFTVVRDFVQSHRFGNASIPEFRAFVQNRTPVALSGFFDAWLTGTTPPTDQYLFPRPIRG